MKREYIIRFLISMAVFSLCYIAIGSVFEPTFFLGEIKRMAGGTKKEEKEIKDAVLLYNKIFADLYASNGIPIMLNDFPANKQLRHELYQGLGFLRGGNLILVYDMADIVFKEIKRPTPMTAEVTVFEEWNYVYQKAGTRETARSIKGMGQGFKYLLSRQKSGWVVVDYAPADVKHEKKKEFYY